uniref:nidogen-like domain-containing protein n=1 Tax=Marivita sp. TaxID=2003365 RepID=UPI0025C16486
MAAPSLIRTLGGDAGFGEEILARNDDGSTQEIALADVFPNGLNFFGEVYNSLWVNNNGSVTFDGSLATFTPQTITDGTTPGIFPYWGDVDTRNGDDLNVSPGGNSQGTNLVHYDLDADNGRFTVTWDDVGFFSRDNSLVNAFQLVLTDTSDDPGRATGDFDIEFRYEEIDWTAGNITGSGGLGGVTARAGYSAGNDEGTFFELPQSGIEDAMRALETTPGNTGQDGIWRFQVRNGDVPQTISIASAGAVVEGDTGTTPMEFLVQRDGDVTGELTVDWTAVGFFENPADSAD